MDDNPPAIKKTLFMQATKRSQGKGGVRLRRVSTHTEFMDAWSDTVIFNRDKNKNKLGETTDQYPSATVSTKSMGMMMGMQTDTRTKSQKAVQDSCTSGTFVS